jgi:hypothetical protein
MNKLTDKPNNNNVMFMLLFSMIASSLLLLSVSASTVIAQPYSSGSLSAINSTTSGGSVAQMGIYVDAGGPCNDGGNSATITHF